MSYHDPDFEIDPTADNVHTRVIAQVGCGKKVLELGCSSGYMSRVLVEKLGCRVTGVERDPAAAERARNFCERVLLADLENLDLGAELGAERFDVVVCADVLEHLRDPAAFLSSVRPLVGEEGYLVASIPNVAHAAIVAELIEGRFNYRSEGLLDETHLRFFTLESIHDCLERSGFTITRLERIRVEPEETEFRTEVAALPSELARAIRSHPESTTYQFVLTAHPLEASSPQDSPGTRAAERRLALPPRSLVGEPNELAAILEVFTSRTQFLEERRLGLTREVGKLREDCLLRDARIRELEQEIDRQRTMLRNQEHELQKLQKVISRKEGSLLRRLRSRLRFRAAGRGWE